MGRIWSCRSSGKPSARETVAFSFCVRDETSTGRPIAGGREMGGRRRGGGDGGGGKRERGERREVWMGRSDEERKEYLKQYLVIYVSLFQPATVVSKNFIKLSV